jgi:hypothetical protein
LTSRAKVLRIPLKENIDMGILNAIVGSCFRDDKTGRVVVFPGDRRKRGYLVKSDADELKIRSFLQMFFSAHLSILVLGYFLASEWSREIYHALGDPTAHLFRAVIISLGVFLIVLGLPYLLLWRTFKRARSSFVSPEDEITVTVGRPRQGRVLVVGLAVLGLGILVGALWLATSIK